MMSSGVNILSETIALSAIENIAKYLPRAVKDGNDLEARERVAYGSTMAGITMQLTSTTAQHSMEHAMSAYHHNLPHGAGLIMISRLSRSSSSSATPATGSSSRWPAPWECLRRTSRRISSPPLRNCRRRAAWRI